MSDQRKVMVCSACLRACCWQGVMMCDEYMEAGTVDKTIKELKELKREHSDYWKEDDES